MRKINTSNVNNTVGMPIKSGSIDHLQLAYQEALTSLANSIIGRLPDTSNCYVLYGCVNTGSGSTYTISAGAIYYNGEIYLVSTASFTVAGGQTAVLSFSTTYYSTNADPVTFTDGVARNVHQIRSIAIAAATSGSGISDFANILQTPLALVNDQQSALPSSYTVYFKQDKAVFFATAPNSATITFDFTNAVPGTVVRLKWTYGSGKTLSISAPTGCTVIKDSGNLSAVASANNLLYCIYLGVNESGNNEVSYTLKQY